MACRTPRQKRELRRVVRAPDGDVQLDPSGRLPGRGAYVCADPACIERAIDRGALSRALAVPIPERLREALEGSILSIDQGGIRGQE
ncbi:MAG TPA: YlxR family protein [Candidatus Limnocylindrales bacterium]